MKVFVAVASVIAVSSYQVLNAGKTKEGHDKMSSEKPAALRQEVELDLATEKAKVAAADARRAAAKAAAAASGGSK